MHRELAQGLCGRLSEKSICRVIDMGYDFEENVDEGLDCTGLAMNCFGRNQNRGQSHQHLRFDVVRRVGRVRQGTWISRIACHLEYRRKGQKLVEQGTGALKSLGSSRLISCRQILGL